jgi:SAM-dependent methyltransferase
MNPAEYANLQAIEERHWYYAGKRKVVTGWLNRVAAPRREQILLDCGAGTGCFAKEMERYCQVLVLDDHEESLQILRTRFRADQILSLAGENVPLPGQSLDYVTALDVLEHVPDDAAVVRGFHRLLKPGGLVVITVPAGMALWSDWDVSLHHFRRYSRSRLCALFPTDTWEIVHVNYTNVLVYPIVWSVRRWRGLRARSNGHGGINRLEDRIPPRPLNAFLRTQFTALAQSSLPFPFGVSLLLVARRRE